MMIPINGLFIIAGVWLVIATLDFLFKRSRKSSYAEWLNNNGLSISLAHIRWHTTMFNRYFIKIGHSKPKFFLIWFYLGALFGCVTMVVSVVILCAMLYKSFTHPDQEQILQPVMPGMNMPWNQVVYYMFTLIVAGGFHEIGHAVASARENVRVNSFGVFILFIYPGAFVELHTDQLEIIQPIRRLRIFTAGVWHNFVLAMFAICCSYTLPYMLWPLYQLNNGIVVTWTNEQYSIHQTLPVGDVITGINLCPIKTSSDWYECLQNLEKSGAEGYCNTKTYVKMHNTSLPTVITNMGEPDCCNDTTSYRFCFTYHTTKYTSLIKNLKKNRFNELVRTSNEYISKFTEHACLPARHTIQSKQTCKLNNDCTELYQPMLCMKPLTSNFTKVIQIKRKNSQDILFVGNVNELLYSVAVSNYIPRYFFSLVNFPHHLNSLCMYLISISSALAILNMVPCFCLDGHQTLLILLEIYFPTSPKLRSTLGTVILMFGSLLLISNITIACYSLVRP